MVDDPVSDENGFDDEEHRRRRPLGRVGAGAARKLRSLSFNRIFPNMLTLLAACAGLTAIRYGIGGQWDRAIIALVAAAMLDGVDGRIARLLRGTSKFGAELDSLADAINFGVAPAIIMYLWAMHQAGGIGWALCLLHAVSCVLRLARFNTMIDLELPHWAHNYFTGVPAPFGAGIAVLPLILWLQTDFDVFAHPVMVGAFLLASSVLMVSRVPVYSGKHMRLKPQWVVPIMVVLGAFAGFLVTEPWATLAVVGIGFMASIPISAWTFHRLKMRTEAHPEEAH
jgi:CDP-diacylglycerol--serine O-phosphatidyltransferase